MSEHATYAAPWDGRIHYARDMSQELVPTIKAAIPLLTSIANAAGAILNQVRANIVVSEGDRQRLKTQINVYLSSQVGQALFDMGVQNMEYGNRLHDLARSDYGRPGYENSLRVVEQTTRLLARNLDNLARRLE